MSVITIHSLDKAVDRRIRDKARREGKSLNQTIKDMLAGSMGIGSSAPVSPRQEFDDFLGIWSGRDVEEFENATADHDRIDEADWR